MYEFIVGQTIAVQASFNTTKWEKSIFGASVKHIVVTKGDNLLTFDIAKDFRCENYEANTIDAADTSTSVLINKIKQGQDSIEIFSCWLYAYDFFILNVQKDTFVDQQIARGWWTDGRTVFNPNDSIIVYKQCTGAASPNSAKDLQLLSRLKRTKYIRLSSGDSIMGSPDYAQ